MSAGAAQRVVLGAWIAMIGLASVKRLTDPVDPGLPAPSVYLGSAVLFTMLFGAATLVGPLAAAIAVGVDVGALMRPYLAGSSSSVLTQLADYLGQLEGQPAGAAAPSGG